MGHKNFTYVEDFKFKEYKIWYRYMKNKNKTYGDTSKKYSVHSLRRFYSILNRIMDEGLKNGWIKYNIVKISDGFAFNNDNSHINKIRFQTVEEFNLFMTVVDERFWETLFTVLFWHGFRIGELLSLQVKDIDRENLKIHIHHTVSYHTLDNTKYKLSTTKNYKDKWIDININCRELFINYFDEFIKKENVNENSFIFSNKLNAPLWQSTVRQHLKKYYNYLEKRGYKVNRLTTQEFGRHSIATYMKENGATVEQVAYYLRDSEYTIRKIYFHTYEKKIESEINDFFKKTNISNKN